MEFLLIIFCLVVVPVLAYVAVNLAASDGESLHGVYAVPGRWFSLKYFIVRWLLAWDKDREHNIRRRALNFQMLQEKMNETGKMEYFYLIEKVGSQVILAEFLMPKSVEIKFVQRYRYVRQCKCAAITLDGRIRFIHTEVTH